MGASHSHTLYHHGHSIVHRLPAETKLAALVLLVFTVAVTPREQVGAFAAYGTLLALTASVARLPFRFLAARLALVTPFIAFALVIPFIADGPTVEVAGLALSREGLWGTFNIVAKALLGATASIIVTGTTEQARILQGLERLRVPGVLVTIAAFMLRYVVVIVDDLRRMRTAMAARAHDPRWLGQARPMAQAAGATFIRSYERGERVHAAMVSRGYHGSMPSLGSRRSTPADWLAAASVPVLAGLVLSLSVLVP